MKKTTTTTAATGTTKQGDPAIPAISIDKEAQLVKEVGAIISVLDNMENDWEKRANAMRRLQGIAKGGSPRAFPTTFSEQLVKQLKEPLCKQFGDLRSSLVKEAATCIETLSAELGELIEPLVDPLVESVITMLGTTNKVLQAEGNRAMICILSFYKVNRSFAKICYFSLTSKVSTQRQYSIDYIGRIIRAHKRYATGFFDRNLDEIERILKKALVDGIPSIRDLARSVFWDFYSVWERRGDKILESLDPNTKKNLLKDDPRPQKGKLAKTAQDDLLTAGKQQQRKQPSTPKKGQFSSTDPALRLANPQIGDDDNIDDLFFSTNPDVVKIAGLKSPQKSPKKSPQKSTLKSPLKSPQKRQASASPKKLRSKQDGNGLNVGNIGDNDDDDEIMFDKPIDLSDNRKKDLGRLSGMTTSFSAVSFRKSVVYNSGTPEKVQSSSPLKGRQQQQTLSLQEQNERETAERINAFKKLNECLKTQPEYELTKQLQDVLDLIKTSLSDDNDNNNTGINSEAIGRETLEIVLTLIRKYHGYVVYNLDAILAPVFRFTVRHPMCNDLCNAVIDATLASFSQDIVVPLAFRMLRSTVSEGNYGACLPLLTFILCAILAFPAYFHSVAKIKTYLPTLATVAMAGNCAAKATEILIRIFEGSKKDFVIAFLSFSPREYKDMRESLPLIIPGLSEELESYGTERESVTDLLNNNVSKQQQQQQQQQRKDSPMPKIVPRSRNNSFMAVEDKKEEKKEGEPVVVVSMKKKQDEVIENDNGNDLNTQMMVEHQDTGINADEPKGCTINDVIMEENEEKTGEAISTKLVGESPKMEIVAEGDVQPSKAMDDLVLPSSPPLQSDQPKDADATILYGEDDDIIDNNDKNSDVSNTYSYSGDSAAAPEKQSETEEEKEDTTIGGNARDNADVDFDIISNPSIVEGFNGAGNCGSSDVDSLLLDMEEDDDNNNDDAFHGDNNNNKEPKPKLQQNYTSPQLSSIAPELQKTSTITQNPSLLSPPQNSQQVSLSLFSPQQQQPSNIAQSPQAKDKAIGTIADMPQVSMSEDISLYLDDSGQPPQMKALIGRVLCSKTSQEYSEALGELIQTVREDKGTLNEQSAGAVVSAVCSRVGESSGGAAEVRDASLKALCELLALVPELIPLDAMRQAFVAATLVMDEYSAQITQGTIPMLRLSANVLVRMKSANLERYFQMLVGLCSSETAPRVLEAAIHNLSAFCSSVDKGFLIRQQGLILNSLIKPVNSAVAGVRKESTLCLAECCALLPDNQFFVEKLKTKLTPVQMRLVTYYYQEKAKF